MRILCLAAFANLVVVPMAGAAPTATGLPATLETKTQAAFADIAKAKAALDAGQSKTSQGWLSKAEGLLKSVLDAAPGAGGLLGKVGGQPPTAQSGSGQQSTSGLSQAESEVAKVDPSMTSRPGAPAPGAQATADAGATAPAPSAAGNAPGPNSGLRGLVDVYQKVTLARSLLKSGENSKAKSLLDQIPASPVDVLKTAGGL
jgi:hypothetical protein